MVQPPELERINTYLSLALTPMVVLDRPCTTALLTVEDIRPLSHQSPSLIIHQARVADAGLNRWHISFGGTHGLW